MVLINGEVVIVRAVSLSYVKLHHIVLYTWEVRWEILLPVPSGRGRN